MIEQPVQPESGKGRRKRFMLVNRKAPYGSVYALESLEVALIGAAFEQDISLVFLDDGIFQLVAGQDTQAIAMKNFSPAFRALPDHGVERIYVARESLQARGLSPADLVVPATVLDRAGLADLMDAQDVVLSF